MLYQEYIIDPDPYLLPAYKLSPFNNEAIHFNRLLPASQVCDSFLNERYPKRFIEYCTNGRAALNLALQDLKLEADDVVSILTTSQNFYISSCVTAEIEKFCKWDREVTNRTSVILVNHEFGFPYQSVNQLNMYGLPIIEDCAYAFNSQVDDGTVGTIGDYVIYSLPKFFPVQVGGILSSKRAVSTKEKSIYESYIKNVLSYYVTKTNEFSAKRIENYRYLASKFESLNINPRFGGLSNGTVPGVFMMTLPSAVDSKLLKQFMYANGVECSAFYGENGLFIPCHHQLNQADLDYFFQLIAFYINNRTLP